MYAWTLSSLHVNDTQQKSRSGTCVYADKPGPAASTHAPHGVAGVQQQQTPLLVALQQLLLSLLRLLFSGTDRSSQ
jgi:hypothetical protein